MFFLSFIKGGISYGEVVIYLVIFLVLVLVEWMGFSRCVVFEAKKMKIASGLQRMFGHRFREVHYKDIDEIKEVVSIRRKFSNLKIITEKRVYMIPVSGIKDYEKMKAELEFRTFKKK